MKFKEYEISEEEFEDMGFKDIEVPKIKNFDINDYYNNKELEGMDELVADDYPFFTGGFMELKSNSFGFEDSSSFDSEDYSSDILD